MEKTLNRPHLKKFFQALHPSLLSFKLLLTNWKEFLRAEFSNLLVLFSAVYLMQKFFLFNKLRLWFYWLIILFGRKFLAGGFCSSRTRFNGHTVVMTGADSGIGKEVAKEFTLRGAHIVIASRDLEKAAQTKKELMDMKGSVEVRYCDLSSLQSVRDFANSLIKHKYHIHMIVNIAGEMMTPNKVTAEGLEYQMTVNHLGHFLMTNMLLPWLLHDKPAMVINVSCTAHLDGEVPFSKMSLKDDEYDRRKAYCNSKLATVLFTKELSKRLEGTNVRAFCANPGMTHSSLYSHILPPFIYKFLFRMFLQTPYEAAQTILHCATQTTQQKHIYYSECCPGWPNELIEDDKLAEKWWEESERLVGLKQ